MHKGQRQVLGGGPGSNESRSLKPHINCGSKEKVDWYLVVEAGGVGDVHVVGGGAELLIALVSEDVDTSEMGLGVTVLTGLRGGHLEKLAGVALEEDETALAQRRALGGDDEIRVGDLTTMLGHVWSARAKDGMMREGGKGARTKASIRPPLDEQKGGHAPNSSALRPPDDSAHL